MDQVDIKERAERLKKALTMLKAELDPKKLEETEELVSRIMSDLEESINRGELSDSRPLYEQQSLAIKLQSILENILTMAEELEQLKEMLKSME